MMVRLSRPEPYLEVLSTQHAWSNIRWSADGEQQPTPVLHSRYAATIMGVKIPRYSSAMVQIVLVGFIMFLNPG